MVLDGGSFTVTLYFGPHENPIRLFIVNPTRRGKPKEMIFTTDVNDGPDQPVRFDSQSGRQLYHALKKAESDPQLSPETQAICPMVEQLLQNPDLSWGDVHFVEKWE